MEGEFGTKGGCHEVGEILHDEVGAARTGRNLIEFGFLQISIKSLEKKFDELVNTSDGFITISDLFTQKFLEDRVFTKSSEEVGWLSDWH